MKKENGAVAATRNKVKINKLVNFDVSAENPVKVSVVVPVCNVQMYLRQCLNSIITQTLKEIEIICVNDGSKDMSELILEEYAAKDSRVKIIDKENAGYGHAMNIGMDMAQGEYIGIVESDDYIESTMYEDLYKIAKENDLDFIKSDFNRFTEEDGILKKYFNSIVPSVYKNRVLTPRDETAVFRGVLNTWSGIYKHSFLTKFNIRHNETPGASYQDNGFFFQTFMYADRGYFYNNSYYMNRRDNPNSSVYSNSKMYCMKEEYNYIKDIMDKNKKYSKGLYSVYWMKLFHNYIFTLDRLDNENKKIFLETFFNDFKEANDNNWLDWSVFTEDEKEKLYYILDDKEGFFDTIKEGEVRVSVIIPVYNEEKNLPKCLDSIFSQTLKDIEIICVDDGSTDKSCEIIEKYIQTHDNLHLYHQPNLGAGVARNSAIEKAAGEFIAFMDADDWYPATTILKNLYIAAKRNKVKICGGSFSSFINGKVVTEYGKDLSGYTFTENKLMSFSEYQFDYGYHRFIYNLQFLHENNIKFPPYKRYQDPPFFVQAMAAAEKFYSIKQVVYCYRKDNAKLTWTKEKLIDMLHGVQDNMRIAKEHGWAKLYYANVNRVNADYVKIIVSFMLPDNKDVVLEVLKIQYLIDEDLIKEAIGGNSQQYIIKPLWRAMFDSKKQAAPNTVDSNLHPIQQELDDLREEIEALKEQVNRKNKKCVISRAFNYLKKHGFKCTIIRIFRGKKAAQNYIEKNKRKLK